MGMVSFAFPWIVIALTLLLSLWAWPQFEPSDRLPMQWGLDGKPTWRAPRAFALFLTPVIAAAIMAAFDSIGGAAAHNLITTRYLMGFIFGISHVLYVFAALRDLGEQIKNRARAPAGRGVCLLALAGR